MRVRHRDDFGLDSLPTLLGDLDGQRCSLADEQPPRRMQNDQPATDEAPAEQPIARPIPQADELRMVHFHPIAQDGSHLPSEVGGSDDGPRREADRRSHVRTPRRSSGTTSPRDVEEAEPLTASGGQQPGPSPLVSMQNILHGVSRQWIAGNKCARQFPAGIQKTAADRATVAASYGRSSVREMRSSSARASSPMTAACMSASQTTPYCSSSGRSSSVISPVIVST